MKYAITLANGQTVEGEILISSEADFGMHEWKFHIDDDVRVSAGKFLVISFRDIEESAARAAQGKEPSST